MPLNLQGFRRQLAQMISVDVRRDLATEAARRFLRLIDQGFELERDPYGVPWVPSKKAKGKTLTRTGQLRSGMVVRADSRGRTIEADVTGSARLYAHYHLDGTSRMPQRRFVPQQQDLPDPWRRELERVHDDYFQRRWGR